MKNNEEGRRQDTKAEEGISRNKRRFIPNNKDAEGIRRDKNNGE